MCGWLDVVDATGYGFVSLLRTVLSFAKARGMACVQEIIIVLDSQRGDERVSQELMC